MGSGKPSRTRSLGPSPPVRDPAREASLVAAGIRRSATLWAMATAERQAVDACADYLLNFAPYLDYDKALADGLPIATGVIEGTCRHLVEDRMNLTGARWSLTGAEAVLRLRALRASGGLRCLLAVSRTTGTRTQSRLALRQSSRARGYPLGGLLISAQPSQHSENRRKERRVVRGLATARLPLIP